MAGNLVQIQWDPPPIEEWDLTRNCSSFARFVSTTLRKSEQLTEDVCVFDVYALHEYVASSLSPTLQESDKNFTRTHTAIWYLSVCDPSSSLDETWSSECWDDHACHTALDFHHEIHSMIDQAWHGKGTCIEELRSSLDFKGNADMAGIGVMASFCIEAFLIIVFLTAYAVANLRRNDALPNRRRKILDAFRAVLPTFYWSSVLLSLGIIVASLKVSADASGGGQADQLAKWRKGESSYNPYDTQLAAMASLMSAIPPFMAGIMLWQSSRRRRLLNTIILPFLAILLIPLAIIAISWNSQLDWRSTLRRIVDLPLPDMLVMKLYALVASSTLILTLLVGLTLLLYSRKKAGSVQVLSHKLTRMMLFTGLVQIVLLAMMIGSLIVLFFIRAKIVGAGDNSQLEWSFGQVLALTTWIPVVVDFLYTLCVGMKRGLEGHLPGDYSVVQQQGDEDNGSSQERQKVAMQERRNSSAGPESH